MVGDIVHYYWFSGTGNKLLVVRGMARPSASPGSGTSGIGR